MHKIDTAGHSNNQFVDKNPSSGIAGTIVDAAWLNAVQSELVNFIELSQLVLDKTDLQQLHKATQARGIVSVKEYGAKGDGVTDDLAAFNNAITYLKSKNGGVLIVPPGNYYLSGQLTLASAHGITIAGQGIAFDPDAAYTPAAKLLFNHTGTGISIQTSRGLNLSNLAVVGANLATGVYVDRLLQAFWDNVVVDVSVTNAATYAFDFGTTSAVADDNTMFNVFSNLICKARNGIRLFGTSAANVCHCIFQNTSINHENGVGIQLDAADNVTWIMTFIYRRAGTSPGVRYIDTANGANSMYWFHLQTSGGGVDLGANVLNPGVFFGYDLSNGQPLPSASGTGLDLALTTNGLNARGWEIPRRYIRKANNFYNASVLDGEAVRDDNGYGERWYNSVSGLAAKRWLDNTLKCLAWEVIPDGVLANGKRVWELYADKLVALTRLIENKVTYTTGATPDVKHANIVELNYSTAETVTNFTNGVDGQMISVQNIGSASPTLQHGANIKLAGSVNFAFNATFMSSIQLQNRSGVWYEMRRTQL